MDRSSYHLEWPSLKSVIVSVTFSLFYCLEKREGLLVGVLLILEGGCFYALDFIFISLAGLFGKNLHAFLYLDRSVQVHVTKEIKS